MNSIIKSKDLLQKVASNSYKKTPDKHIQDEKTGARVMLIPQLSNATLKLYRVINPSTIVGPSINSLFIIGVRGTVPSDFVDMKADGLIAFNKLSTSKRYENDQRQLKMIFTSNIMNLNTKFFLVGHSLGGALIDLILKGPHKRYILGALSYNPAIEPFNVNNERLNDLHYRIYSEGDALFKTAELIDNDRGFADEVRPRKSHKFLNITKHLPGSIGNLSKAGITLQEHSLDRFKGGGIVYKNDVLSISETDADRLRSKSKTSFESKYCTKKKDDMGGSVDVIKFDLKKDEEYKAKNNLDVSLPPSGKEADGALIVKIKDPLRALRKEIKQN